MSSVAGAAPLDCVNSTSTRRQLGTSRWHGTAALFPTVRRSTARISVTNWHGCSSRWRKQQKPHLVYAGSTHSSVLHHRTGLAWPVRYGIAHLHILAGQGCSNGLHNRPSSSCGGADAGDRPRKELRGRLEHSPHGCRLYIILWGCWICPVTRICASNETPRLRVVGFDEWGFVSPHRCCTAMAVTFDC